MEWDKKEIDKPAEKKSALDARFLGIVRKFKSAMLRKNIRANIFDPADYQTRRLTQDTLINAERRKAEVLTLIRRASFI